MERTSKGVGRFSSRYIASMDSVLFSLHHFRPVLNGKGKRKQTNKKQHQQKKTITKLLKAGCIENKFGGLKVRVQAQ